MENPKNQLRFYKEKIEFAKEIFNYNTFDY